MLLKKFWLGMLAVVAVVSLGALVGGCGKDDNPAKPDIPVDPDTTITPPPDTTIPPPDTTVTPPDTTVTPPASGLDGTWAGDDDGMSVTMTINGGSFEYGNELMGLKGGFATSGTDRFTLTPTHVRSLFYVMIGLDGTKWYSKSDLESALGELIPDSDDSPFIPQTGTYVLDGNTLTLTYDPDEDYDPDVDDPNEPVVLTRK